MKNLWTILALITSMNMVFAYEPKSSETPVINGSWWQIAHEDYDAGAYSNKSKPGEPTLREHQQVSDFTIYKAANGKWQLVSAVRSTNFPGDRHFLFRWEAENLTDLNWAEKGIMKTTADFPIEAGYTEGVFYAPHVVFNDGKYYMFHNSRDTAFMLVSDDGVNFRLWQNPDGSYQIFDPGPAGRDLMVMDNRERDGLWYVYYIREDRSRMELETRQFQDVYARTSPSLYGPWSDEVAVGMGTPDRPRQIHHSQYDFVNAESPFVIYRKGLYFKFEHNHVVASTDPLDFKNKPVVANLIPSFNYSEDWWPALAPEIVIDGEKMYIAMFMNHHEHPLGTLKQGGVFMAEIIWVKSDE
jgi:hypothetical protein